MAKRRSFPVEGKNIHLEDNFISLTDIASLKGDPSPLIQDWLRLGATLAFIAEYEKASNPTFDSHQFRLFRADTGIGSFRVSVTKLQDLGCTGIYAKRGRYGGTYAAVEWAIHFSNWLDPLFYLKTVRSYLQLQASIHGKQAIEKSFTRQMAKDTLRLPTGQALSKLPEKADVLFERRLSSVEADLINLAMWTMTARHWRLRFPDDAQHRKNMRDFATKEELQTISSLQILSQEMQENGFTTEERLHRLTIKAEELINLYCDTDDKKATLIVAQRERGWGRFEF